MKRPLRELLAIDPESVQDDTFEEAAVDSPAPPAATGLCVECGDQPADTSCIKCAEDFCSVCFGYLHRTGKRKQHETRPIVKAEEESATESKEKEEEDTEAKEGEDEMTSDENIVSASHSIQSVRGDMRMGVKSMIDSSDMLAKIKEHCKYVPMRLTMEERKLLRLLEAALNVSEYTDKVDVLTYKSKSKRIVAQLREMCSILAGLVVATDMDLGKNMFFKQKEQGEGQDEDEDAEEEDFAANAEWYKTVFEIGRRYKIMNPEKMRDSFGKLMYMIMDSRLPEIKGALEFDFHKPISTVYSFLESHGRAIELLDDPILLQAVVEIVPEGKARVTIQNEIRRKENAIKILAKKYSVSQAAFYVTKLGPSGAKNASAEDIRQCLYSIGDYHAYLRANRHPVENIIKLLNQYFDPTTATTTTTNGGDEEANADFALDILSGKGGARLSHNHAKQFHYVHQSLTLWSEIMRDMFMLWFQADLDLVSERSRYELADTGQGLNRIKACPSVARSMHNIIKKAMDRTGKWIGSSVVHLGDRAVPNALFFLDKYTQVPRILTPVHIVIQNVDRIARDPYIHDCIVAQFGSIDDLKKSMCFFFSLWSTFY